MKTASDERLAPVPVRRQLRFGDGVELELGPAGAGAAAVRWQSVRLPLGPLSPALGDAVRALAVGTDEEAAAGAVAAREGTAALARWSLLLDRLLALGALRCTLIAAAGGRLASISFQAPGEDALFHPARSCEPAALSRFASLRVAAGVTVLASPLGRARVELHEPQLATVVAALAVPSSAEVLAGLAGLRTEEVAAFLGLARAAGTLADADETAVGQDGGGLALWEVEDAAFHVHSRLGRRGPGYGATFRFGDRVAAPPAVGHAGGRCVALPVPDPTGSAVSQRSLADVLEARRSRRAMDPRPVELAVLAELLYRSARNTGPASPEGGRAACPDGRSAVGGAPAGGFAMERVTRPYPGAGGCHPIEVYLVADRCAGLQRGLYRYEPAGHGLEVRPAEPKRLDQLLGEARQAAGMDEDPPLLVVLAARFARMTWKYEGIAYANLLKDAGGLLQTMYLVAAAMDLAACALGGGDSACFAAAAGTAYWEESSVAELVLGYPLGKAPPAAPGSA